MEDTNAPSILIVDDDEILCETLKIMLKQAGFRIAGEATNGHEAITQCASRTPDLILLDINMPKMGGVEALIEIRKINPHVKVLMMSTEGTIDKVKEAIHHGASGFVVKPMSKEVLLNKVEKLFKKKDGKYIWHEAQKVTIDSP